MKKLVITLAVLLTSISTMYGRGNCFKRFAAAAGVTSTSIQAYVNHDKEMARIRNMAINRISAQTYGATSQTQPLIKSISSESFLKAKVKLDNPKAVHEKLNKKQDGK